MSLVARAKKLWADGGPSGLIGGLGRLVAMLTKRVFFRADYYVHEFDLMSLDDSYSAAPVDGLEVHIVESSEDACALAERGYEDVRLTVPGAKNCLRAGAVGFCAYVDDGILAHIAWVGMTRQAKKSFDALDYDVRFDEQEACTGGSWTFPSFRGRGIYRHVMWHRLRYLRDRGCSICRDATEVHNVASMRGQGVFPSRIVGSLSFVRVFGIDRYRFEKWG